MIAQGHRTTTWLAAAVLLAATPLPRAAAQADASAFASSVDAPSTRREAVKELRRRFLSPVVRSEDPAAAGGLDLAPFSGLDALQDEVEFLHAGRVDGFDDWPTYADMIVYVAGKLGVKPPESALAVYHGRVRPASETLTPGEARARSALLGAISEPGFVKRYLYIPYLIDTAQPELAQAPPPPPEPPAKKGRKGKKRRKTRVARGPELAPPPKQVSVLEQIDWDVTEELADVADNNAHNWDRRKGETARKYARRLRRLRKHCYEWVRRDITALGLWDDRLFRGDAVAGTRRDPKRAIRAASFALAMAKVEATETLASRTPLRELNLRVDPIVRGSILVFAQTACGSDRKSGHIEIVTSVVPLRAASYKFHDVRSDCLVRAAAENLVHVYVPLRRDAPPPPSKTPSEKT